MRKRMPRWWVTAAFALGGSVAHAAPDLDGQITSEGWVHLTEASYAQPVTGGEAASSDLIGEVSAQHRWDSINSVDVDLASTRGDVQNVFVQWNSTYLYIGVEGPTVPYRDWSPGGEEGDMYIALDTRGGEADELNDYLIANDGHTSFHETDDAQAVDFYGWQPTYILGVDWVDNTDFTSGEGWANLEETGTHNVVVEEGHDVDNGGFEWAAGFDSGLAAYEFQVLWTDLGFTESPDALDLRLAVYTTADFDFHDTYDSGPGVGQPGPYEEIGDNPGDLDSGTHGDDPIDADHDASDGLTGDMGNDDLSISGSFPGSNFVDPLAAQNDYNATPGPSDEIDTIQEYYAIAVPEPSTLVMAMLGLLLASGWSTFRRRSGP
jgi:hypothetical protein